VRAKALLSAFLWQFHSAVAISADYQESIVLFDSQLPLLLAKQSVSTASSTVILSSVPGHCPLTTRAAIDMVPTHFELTLWEGNGQINLVSSIFGRGNYETAITLT